MCYAATCIDCNFTTAQGWRECIGQNVAKQAALLTSAAPHLLISAGLMEYLPKFNLDKAYLSDFAACCVPGSIGQWDGHQTNLT